MERVKTVAAAGDRLRADVMDRGKRTVGLDLKYPEGVEPRSELAGSADVIIEVFRPGVAERLGIGPDDLPARQSPADLRADDRLGPGRPAGAHRRARHRLHRDLRRAAALGRAGEKPTPPINLLGDFAGGGHAGVRHPAALWSGAARRGPGDRRGHGGRRRDAVRDYHGVQTGGWGPRGTNLLDTGAPIYDTYETADGKFLAVGALEPQFWAEMVSLMGLTDLPDVRDRSQWPALRERLAEAFGSRTRAEWEAVFDGTDACVSPVLEMDEAADHPHNKARGAFVEVGGVRQPAPDHACSARPSRTSHPPPGWRTCPPGACPTRPPPGSAPRECSRDLIPAARRALTRPGPTVRKMLVSPGPHGPGSAHGLILAAQRRCTWHRCTAFCHGGCRQCSRCTTFINMSAAVGVRGSRMKYGAAERRLTAQGS